MVYLTEISSLGRKEMEGGWLSIEINTVPMISENVQECLMIGVGHEGCPEVKYL
jgi:hypothetical protein